MPLNIFVLNVNKNAIISFFELKLLTAIGWVVEIYKNKDTEMMFAIFNDANIFI